MRKNVIGSVCVCFGIAVAMIGCGEIEEAYDCARVCAAFDDCAEKSGKDIDEVDCFQQCEAAGDQEDEQVFQQRLTACGECLEQAETCAEGIPCTTECEGLVPEIPAELIN